MNIALILEMAAEAAPNRIGLVCEGKRWTYGDFLDAARGAFELIQESGAECVALLDENSEAAVMAMFGAALAGVPYCPLDDGLADADLAAQLGHLPTALVVGDEERIIRIAGEQDHIIYSREEFALKVQETVPEAQSREYDPGEGIAIQIFTDETAEAPKASMLRHSDLLNTILGAMEFGSATADDAALLVAQPHHIAGISALLASIYSLRKVMVQPAFSPGDWLTRIAADAITHAFLAPTMLLRIVEAMEMSMKANVESLRSVTCGGDVPMDMIRKAQERFPLADFVSTHDLIEGGSTIIVLDPNDYRTSAHPKPGVRPVPVRPT